MRLVSFNNISNVRDLGGIPLCDGRMVKPGLIYRGGALNAADDADIEKFTKGLSIARIIDLRVGYERVAKPDREFEGVENLYIPFYDNDVVGREYFKPIPGTIVIGNDFACDPNDFYADMPNELTAAQMAKVLNAVFESACADMPVYYHCSGGKDRVGITTLLILEILGASEDAILEDYLLTNVSREAKIEGTYQRFLRLCQGDEEFARKVTKDHAALPENLTAFRASVDRRYGSMDVFVRSVLSFDERRICDLRQALTVEA